MYFISIYNLNNTRNILIPLYIISKPDFIRTAYPRHNATTLVCYPLLTVDTIKCRMLEKKITVVKSTSGSDRELCMKSTLYLHEQIIRDIYFVSTE